MDAVLAVLTILMGNSGVTSLVGVDPTTSNHAIYGGQLPEHFNPEVTSSADPSGNGPAVTILVKGGTSHPEMPLQDVDVQVKIWTGVNQNASARTVYNAVLNALDGVIGVVNAGGQVKRIMATIPGVDDVDPDTGWAVCVGAFNVMIM
jgi:hypothetical protein